jgi:hypothetical protein
VSAVRIPFAVLDGGVFSDDALANLRRGTARVVAPDGPPPRRRRAKLWELQDSFHCSIIGTCLTTGELRRVMGKATQTNVSRASDHDLHALLAAVRIRA